MNGINDVIFEVGYQCNGKCGYCFQKARKHQTEILSISKAVSFIKYLKDYGKIEDNFSIMVIGGETLLYMDWIRNFIDKMISENLHYPIRITTNGALLDENLIKELIELKINPTISIDGGFLTQEQNRGSLLASEKIFEQIKNYVGEVKKHNLFSLCQSTFTPYTIGRLFESYLFIRHLGFNRWWYELESLSQISADKWNNTALSIYKNQLRQVLKFQKLFPDFEIIDLDSLIQNSQGGINKKQTNRLNVDIYGNVTFSALGILRLNDEYEDFIKLGNISTGIDFDKMEKIQWCGNAPLSYPSKECRQCGLNGYCILEESLIGKLQDLTNCAWWKILWEVQNELQ